MEFTLTKKENMSVNAAPRKDLQMSSLQVNSESIVEPKLPKGTPQIIAIFSSHNSKCLATIIFFHQGHDVFGKPLLYSCLLFS